MLNTSVKSAKCKWCGLNIPKQSLRFSEEEQDYHYYKTNHYHLKCYMEACKLKIKDNKLKIKKYEEIIKKIKKEKKALEQEQENFVIEKL